MDMQSIEYHEKNCKQRDIDCPETCPEWCKEIIPFSSLFDHLKTTHGISFNEPRPCDEPDFDYEKKGSKYIFNVMRDIKESHFEDHPYVISLQQDHLQIQDKCGLSEYYCPAPKDLKKYCPVFSVHFLLIGEISMAKVFVQFLGSRPVATNYKYAIKVEDPEFGDYYHKSQVKSLDDKKEELFKSNACLMLPLEMLREYIGKEFKFIVEIEEEEEEICCEHNGRSIVLLSGQLSQNTENQINIYHGN